MSAPAPPEDLVPLGVVARAHGVAGELRVHPYNPDTELLGALELVWLRAGPGAAPRAARVESWRVSKGVFLAQLEGVEDRDAADALKGTEVCVPRAALPEPEPDEFYHVDVIGLPAVGPDGAPIGVVAEVVDYPSTAVFRVEDAAGARAWEVPVLPRYVVEVDLAAGRVVVDHLDELPEERPRPKRVR